MTKQYQINDTKTTDALELAVPPSVSVAMDEIAADMREGLLVVCLRNSKVCFGYADSDRAGVAGDRGTAG